MASIKDHLENTFDDLGEAKLKKFKKKLCDRKEQPRVSKATVEKLMDGQDLADEMVSTFTSANALLVSLEILRAIGSNELAKELEEKTGCGEQNGREERIFEEIGEPEPLGAADSSKAGQALSLKNADPAFQLKELKLTLCSQSFKNKILKEKGDDIYEIKDKSVRRRLALLINNVEFDDETMKRRGSERDFENMKWLLEKLDYQVVTHKNLSAEGMENAIQEFALRKEHAFSDSAFVVIMSHGKRGAILGVHYQHNDPSDILPVDHIYHYLNSQNCPGLRDKPKVILIQACRGDEEGRFLASDSVASRPVEAPGDEYMHKEKDFVSLMSCTPDTISYRHMERGTFYVQNLVDVFMKSAHEDHIDELFRKVIKRFESPNLIGQFKQMACKDRASMPKLFYLFPGL